MTMLLTRDDLRELTGYRQPSRQLAWLAEHLRIKPPRRVDGLPVVSRAQVEAALAGARNTVGTGPNWSKATS
jgi:hypothetical protein